MGNFQKTSTEIQIMLEGGKLLAKILKQLVKSAKVSTRLIDIENQAYQLLLATGGQPNFSKVPGYRWATCINVNQGIVHGIPNNYNIKDGDLISLDIGLLYKNFNTDMSTSFQVGEKTPEVTQFLQAGQKALSAAIKQVKPGNRIGHISKAIQKNIEKHGYRCVPNLIGHGIGRNLHEYPPVPGVLSQSIEETVELVEGMTIAIEVIYVQGEPKTITDRDDGWTISTQDGKISAVFERTIAVVSDGCLVLTQ